MKILLILLLAIPTLAQLPGNKVYLDATETQKKQMVKDLKKAGFVFGGPDDSDFVISYKMLFQNRVSTLQLPVETGQMDVYFFKDEKKIMIWSDSVSDDGWPPHTLIKRFIKFTKPKR